MMSHFNAANQKKQYVLKRSASIGAADAEDDTTYLSTSFIDTGDWEILKDLDDSRSIVVGRTGSGKTALLEEFHRRKSLNIKIDPANLAINYVADNLLLKALSELGVNMDQFYRLLWKHVFVTELLKKHYKIDNESRKDNFLVEWQRKRFDSKSKQMARDYLVQWGDSIWKETEYRVIEQTDSLEN